MTQEKELELYKLALIDWERPMIDGDFTDRGLCLYFKNKFKDCFDKSIYVFFDTELPTLYNQRTILDSTYHYPGKGSDAEGRSNRVRALKNSIEILEKTLT